MSTIISSTTASNASSTLNNIASTYGWDTVFAMPIADVNKVIVAKKTSPKSFQYDIQTGMSITGNFSDWQITRGGDGKLIHMEVPLTSITLSANGKVFIAQNIAAVIEVELHYIPHDEQPDDVSQGTLHNLVVKSQASVPEEKVVTVLNLIVPTEDNLDPLVSIYMKTGLELWFNANLSQFEHVFATVNLNRKADKGQWEWLYPTYTGYAYIDRTQDEDCLLGILCMTQDRSADSLAEQISEAAIPLNSKAGFLISGERFLTCLVLPQMETNFPGSNASDFELYSNGLGIRNTVDIKMSPIEHDGSTYNPVMKTFNFEIDGNQIKVYSHSETEVSAGITAWCDSTHWYDISLGTNSSGEQTLIWKETQTAIENHGVNKAVWVEITEEIATVVLVIVGVVFTALTDGAGAIVVALIAGLITGVAGNAANIEALIAKNDAPSMDMLVLNSTDPIKWSDSQDFKLDYASLNESLQLGGDANFTG